MLRDSVTAHVPEGELLFAIGDIHGRVDLLNRILAQIESDVASQQANEKTLVFVGDYVDRGPDSRGVIEILLHGLPESFSAHFIKGNHEAMLLHFLDDPNRLDHWRMNGGEPTMASYGVDVVGLKASGASTNAWRDAFMNRLPPAHLDFYRHLALEVSAGDYLFVHAGVRPDVPLDDQDEHDLLWIRDEFLDSAENLGKVVVHGHTPTVAPVVRPNRIGIDTGAVFSGKLTALRLYGANRSFLQT
jgi:serine/threonine protein phosphatase 1